MASERSRKILGAVAIAGVIGLIVVGLVAVRGPGENRELREDSRRSDRLQELHFLIESYAAQEGEVPETLEQLSSLREISADFDPRVDPISGASFDYRKTEQFAYEVCATFNRASEGSDVPRGLGPESVPSFYDHPAGRHCFEAMLGRAGREGPAPPGKPDR